MNKRRLGRIVLIVACIIATLIGFARKPDYIDVGNVTEKSVYVFDEAGVLNSSAIKAVEKANSSMDAKLYVVTIKDTGSMTTEDYCYFWQESHSLKQTDCELLIVTGNDSYWFIYGSALANSLDYEYDRLLDKYYVPYMDYSEAVQKFSAALAKIVEVDASKASYYAYAGGGGSSIGQFILMVILIIVVIAIIRAISRRMYYWSGYNYQKPWYAPSVWWNSRPIIYKTYVTPRDRYPTGYYTYPTQKTVYTVPSGNSGNTYRGNGWGNPPPTQRSRTGFSGGGGYRSSSSGSSYSSGRSSYSGSSSSRSSYSGSSSSRSSYSGSSSSSGRSSSSFSSSRSSGSSGFTRSSSSGFSGGGGTRGKK